MLVDAFFELLNLWVLVAALVGIVSGIIIGAIPGLGPTMAIALLIPVTFSMQPIPAIILLLGVYQGAIFGGSISAVLLNVPGTPSSAATAIDGFAMARRGEGGRALRFALYEPAEFISNHLVDKLEWNQVRDHVAIHVPCSSKKLGVEGTFAKIAQLCSKEVTPSGIPCCGMAGDRGMRFPELTGSSLSYLELPQSCSDGKDCFIQTARPLLIPVCSEHEPWRDLSRMKVMHAGVRIQFPPPPPSPRYSLCLFNPCRHIFFACAM